MLVGATLVRLQFGLAAYIFCIGAVAFVATNLLQRYDGSNITIRRLRRIMIVSDLLLLLTGLLMIANSSNFFQMPYLSYLRYVKNNWVIVLLVAASMLVYSTWRIEQELGEEAKKR